MYAQDAGIRPGLTDQWDVPIWAAAVESNAQDVVSENTHDFPPAQGDGRHVFEGIEYLAVDAFVAMFTDEEGESADEGPPSLLSFFARNGPLPDILADDTPEE